MITNGNFSLNDSISKGTIKIVHYDQNIILMVRVSSDNGLENIDDLEIIGVDGIW